MRTLACLLLGAAMVGLYHLLPRTRPGPPFRAALLVLSGFILAQGGLRAEVRDSDAGTQGCAERSMR
jgi:hypothetical protein